MDGMDGHEGDFISLRRRTASGVFRAGGPGFCIHTASIPVKSAAVVHAKGGHTPKGGV